MSRTAARLPASQPIQSFLQQLSPARRAFLGSFSPQWLYQAQRHQTLITGMSREKINSREGHGEAAPACPLPWSCAGSSGIAASRAAGGWESQPRRECRTSQCRVTEPRQTRHQAEGNHEGIVPQPRVSPSPPPAPAPGAPALQTEQARGQSQGQSQACALACSQTCHFFP